MIVKLTREPYFYSKYTKTNRPIKGLTVDQYAAVVEQTNTTSLLVFDNGRMEHVANACLEQVSDKAAVLRQQWWNTAGYMYDSEDEQVDQYVWFIRDYAQRLSNSGKTCNQCGHFKPLGDFGKREASADGLQPICKECVTENNARRYKERHKGTAL